MKNLKILIVITTLLLLGHQSQSQQSNGAKTEKKKRMFFYPSQETPVSLTVLPLTLYPNPASQTINIGLPKTVQTSEEGFALELANKHGIKLISKKWNGEKLDVSQFPSGIYIVTLRKGQQYYSQKLVVKRE